MSQPTRARLVQSAPVVILILVGFVGIAFGDENPAIQTALEATKKAEITFSLAGKALELAAGATLLGLGVGVIIASTAMYWYQNKQIERRLE